LLTQILAGRGLSAASVAIDPAPFRGVLPLPISALRSAKPVLGNPANAHRAVPLTFEQFRYGFANAVSEEEAKDLYETYAVPGSGEPIFQAAAANLNPWTEAKVDTKNPDRGPLLIIEGEEDHTVPVSIAKASVIATAGGGSATYDGLGQTLSACSVTGTFVGDLSCANSPSVVGPAAGTMTISPVVSGQVGNFNVTQVTGPGWTRKERGAAPPSTFATRTLSPSTASVYRPSAESATL
jgi:hypothetical protein